jgi:hypothetical protein
MDSKLKQFIEKKLELENLSYSEKCDKIESKIEELEKVTEELKNYLEEEVLTLRKEIEKKIKEEFPQLYVKIYTTDSYYEITIPFIISKMEFLCCLTLGSEYKNGICTVYDAPKNDKIIPFLKPLFERRIIEAKKEDEWYGYKETSDAEAFDDFKNLVSAVLELEK